MAVTITILINRKVTTNLYENFILLSENGSIDCKYILFAHEREIFFTYTRSNNNNNNENNHNKL